MSQPVGADTLALRRLSRTLDEGSVELLRIKRRVEAVGARLPASAWMTADLVTTTRWLADRAVDVRRRALQLEDESLRSPARPGKVSTMPPWFSDEACPKALVTVQWVPRWNRQSTSQPSEHLAANTTCQVEARSVTAVATPLGLTLVPNGLRSATRSGDDERSGRAAGAPTAGEPEPLPRGFRTVDGFVAFARNLRSGLRNAGLADAEAALQGSSVTGRSFRTGAPFDDGRTSDLDVTIASPTAMERAKALGVGLRSGGTRTGPLTTAQLDRLGLGDLAQQLTQDLGREVHFMLYESIEAASARGPLTMVPVR